MALLSTTRGQHKIIAWRRCTLIVWLLKWSAFKPRESDMRKFARLIRITSLWGFKRLPEISAISSLFFALQRTRISDSGANASILVLTSILLYNKASWSSLSSKLPQFLDQNSRNRLNRPSKRPILRKNSKYRSFLAKQVWLRNKPTTKFPSHLRRLAGIP